MALPIRDYWLEDYKELKQDVFETIIRHICKGK